jgi:hypothetical protein
MDIKINPSDELAQQIEASWDRAFEGVNIDLVSRVTLPVRVPDVEALLADWKAEIARLTEEDPNNRFLCIHIGNFPLSNRKQVSMPGLKAPISSLKGSATTGVSWTMQVGFTQKNQPSGPSQKNFQIITGQKPTLTLRKLCPPLEDLTLGRRPIMTPATTFAILFI